ncbi:MAG: calcium-binding protein, partial [Mangrovicoccus sp.]
MSFTGSSLGGIVAGVMGAISNLPALTSATGPHSLAIENLVPLLVLHPDEAALTPDASGVFNLRITGEILNDAVELVRTLVNAAQVAGDLGLLSDEDAAAIDALDAKFGDGVRVGTNLPELDAGEAFSSSLLNGILSGDITDSILLHYAASHAFQFHAQGVLGYSAYKSVDGFSRAFYDPSLWGLAYSDVSSALSDLTASVLDGRSDILTPLLFDAEFRLSVVDAVYFGPNYISETGQSVITTTLSKMAVEYAYQQVSFGGDYGPIMTLDEAGWLTIDPLAMFDGAQYSSVFTEFYAFLMPGLAGAVAPDIDLIHVQAAQTTGDLALGDENDLVLAGNGDHFINTGGGDDVIQTGEAADFIRAGTGDDFVLSAAGAQQINGDGGNDWLSYARSDLGVYVELFEGFGIGGHAEGDLITGVENLIGSDFDDTFYGDDVANIFFGGAGFDVEYGNGGDDVFVFLGGSDTDVIGDFTTGDKVLIDSALASEFDELLEFGDDIDGNAVFA